MYMKGADSTGIDEKCYIFCELVHALTISFHESLGYPWPTHTAAATHNYARIL